jgi:hypothetical protein
VPGGDQNVVSQHDGAEDERVYHAASLRRGMRGTCPGD